MRMIPGVLFFCLSIIAGARLAGGLGDRASIKDLASVASFLEDRTNSGEHRVFLLHVDGFQSQILQSMLTQGQLPHFRFLIDNGSSSFSASTVDKSETMKVIPSVLSSRVDTRITAWWQFDRDSMRFRNFWLDPVEVVNYALGLDFPLYPTVIDVVANEGHPERDIVAGFNLYRRGVPAKNYSRIYLEGFGAVSSHRYYQQAFATTTELINTLNRKVAEGSFPKLILGLLAPIDEMIHLNGLTKNGEHRREYCFDRSSGTRMPADDIMDQLASAPAGWLASSFTKISKNWKGRIDTICIRAPVIENRQPDGTLKKEHVYPEVALAFIAVDLNIGRLIQALREVRISKGQITAQRVPLGIDEYQRAAHLESSAFEQTLFLIYGDHGMTDTFHLMNAPLNFEAEKANRSPESLPYPFVRSLAEKYDLKAFIDEKAFGSGTRLVIDSSNLPPELKSPSTFSDWQPSPVRELVSQSNTEAQRIFSGLKVSATSIIHDKYWYMVGPLKTFVVDPKIDKATAEHGEAALTYLRRTILRGKPEYVNHEREYLKSFYNKNVAMIYGGGALNNAEIFLPHQSNGTPDWTSRPSQREILQAFDGSFLKRTASLPGVGLIYIRRENAEITEDHPLPNLLHIDVFDKALNHGLITVRRDRDSHQQIYHYRSLTAQDPIGYEALGSTAGRWGTYQEWNDLSVEHETFYQNGVAGIGSYLATDSSAVGDVLLLHAPGWNFGENLGGHGGIEAAEKLMTMISFGPGVKAHAPLQASCRYSTDNEGRVVAQSRVHQPTILDVAPTAMAHLGYTVDASGAGGLTHFARSGFDQYFATWRKEQGSTCSQQGLIVARAQLNKLGFNLDAANVSTIDGLLKDLCRALRTENTPKLPDFAASAEDGCVMH